MSVYKGMEGAYSQRKIWAIWHSLLRDCGSGVQPSLMWRVHLLLQSLGPRIADPDTTYHPIVTLLGLPCLIQDCLINEEMGGS